MAAWQRVDSVDGVCQARMHGERGEETGGHQVTSLVTRYKRTVRQINRKVSFTITFPLKFSQLNIFWLTMEMNVPFKQ